MKSHAFSICSALLSLGWATISYAQPPKCQLCAPAEQTARAERPRIPITIDVETALDFSRVAQTGQGGNIDLDPVTGGRRVSGELSDLGGMGIRGTVRITGEPMAQVLITLPNRVTSRSTTGASAEIIEIKSDLPHVAQLSSEGVLRFSFGGRLVVSGAVSGTFRGGIPISADYP